MKRKLKFNLTEEDIHNMYDLLEMISWPEIVDTLKLNGMDKWFYDLHHRLEKEIFKDDKENK